MKEILERVINRKNYKLVDMLERLKTAYAEGRITNAEFRELENAAFLNATLTAECGLEERITMLEERVKAIEAANKQEQEEAVEAYVEGKWYYNGNKVLFNDAVYKCIAPVGVVCVWNPSVYPAYWELV